MLAKESMGLFDQRPSMLSSLFYCDSDNLISDAAQSSIT